MGTVVEVREVTVQIDIVAVVTFCTRHRVVTAVVGTIRVSAGENEEIDIVQDILNACVSTSAELIDETQHKDHARHLVAVHGRGVEELRLAVGLAVVEAYAKDSTVVGGGQCT